MFEGIDERRKVFEGIDLILSILMLNVVDISVVQCSGVRSVHTNVSNNKT